MDRDGDLGRDLRPPATDHGCGARPGAGGDPFLARPRGLSRVRRLDLDRGDPPGLLMGGGRAFHRLRDRSGAPVALANGGRHVHGREPRAVRLERLGDAASARALRGGTRALPGGEGDVVSFHTNHRLLVAFSFFGYFALTYLIAIGPALEVQHTKALPAARALSADAARGRELYLA